jgi:putative lipoic acid-binding regulatory protein
VQLTLIAAGHVALRYALAREFPTMHDDDTLFDFPCDFPIKAMGRAGCGLDLTVVEIVRRHAPDISEGRISTRDSAQGNYTSVTVVVRATSRAQLDAIYQELVDCSDVIMAL